VREMLQGEGDGDGDLLLQHKGDRRLTTKKGIAVSRPRRLMTPRSKADRQVSTIPAAEPPDSAPMSLPPSVGRPEWAAARCRYSSRLTSIGGWRWTLSNASRCSTTWRHVSGQGCTPPPQGHGYGHGR
jgi:hypothetical protein